MEGGGRRGKIKEKRVGRGERKRKGGMRENMRGREEEREKENGEKIKRRI